VNVSVLPSLFSARLQLEAQDFLGLGLLYVLITGRQTGPHCLAATNYVEWWMNRLLYHKSRDCITTAITKSEPKKRYRSINNSARALDDMNHWCMRNMTRGNSLSTSSALLSDRFLLWTLRADSTAATTSKLYAFYRYLLSAWYYFCRSFFCRGHDNSQTAARSLVKFSTNMYLDNRTNPIDFQGHASKVKVTGPDFRIFHHCEIGQKCL